MMSSIQPSVFIRIQLVAFKKKRRNFIFSRVASNSWEDEKDRNEKMKNTPRPQRKTPSFKIGVLCSLLIMIHKYEYIFFFRVSWLDITFVTTFFDDDFESRWLFVDISVSFCVGIGFFRLFLIFLAQTRTAGHNRCPTAEDGASTTYKTSNAEDGDDSDCPFWKHPERESRSSRKRKRVLNVNQHTGACNEVLL